MRPTIILIDDQHAKGWEQMFRHIIKDTYGDMVDFVALQMNGETSESFYNKAEESIEENVNALFILDNQFGDGYIGMDLLKKYGKYRSIIMHSADKRIGHESAQAGSLLHMYKDDPADMMSNTEMQEMILDFHKTIIHKFEFVPEMIWIPMRKMGLC
jgi:hypothetical protein